MVRANYSKQLCSLLKIKETNFEMLKFYITDIKIRRCGMSLLRNSLFSDKSITCNQITTSVDMRVIF